MQGHVSVKLTCASLMLPMTALHARVCQCEAHTCASLMMQQAVLHAWACQCEAHIRIHDVAIVMLMLLTMQGC